VKFFSDDRLRGTTIKDDRQYLARGLNCFLNVGAKFALLGLAQLDVEHLHEKLDGAALQVWVKKINVVHDVRKALEVS
jgi:hypothetical protein